MRALVTGGAGLIGSHVVDLLLERGYDVTILDNLDVQTHPKGRPPWIPPESRFVHGDVRDRDALAEALDGVEVVFHQAAFGGFTEEIANYIDANATGTARLFEVIRNRSLPVRKVVLASSQAIFGEGLYVGSRGPVHPPPRSLAQLDRGEWEVRDPATGEELRPAKAPEGLSADGVTPYALSKLFEEKIGLAFGRTMAIPVVALRYAVTFGPRQSVYNPYTGVISIFSTRLLNDLPPVVFEDGRQTRDFIFVKDVAAANVFLMERDGVGDEVFNVGTGVPTRMADLARTLARVLGRDLEPELPGEYRPGDVRHFVHDSSKLYGLGFRPRFSLEEGLSEFVTWVRDQGPLEERFGDAAEGLRKLGVIRSASGSAS